LFSGIRKLGGGMMLSVELNGRVQEHRYWDAIMAARPVTGSDDEIAEQLLAALRKSVKLRKLSDVPVGVFLSGGLDSSAIAALFCEGEAQAVKTFTVGYDQDYGSYRSEFEYARMAAAHVGAEHHEIRLSARDFIDFLPRMVELQDEPIADPVCAPVHYVARLAREHGVVVAQVGEGADELFWGYPRWKRARTTQRLLDSPLAPNPIKHLLLAGVRAVGKDTMQTYDALERSARGLPIFWGNAERFGDARKRGLLSRRLRERWDGASAWQIIEPIHERYRQGACEPSILNWMTYVDLSIRLPELLLMRVDKMTMGVGLEARVPFLDHELVAFALGIPEEVKTRGGVLKAILKRAVRGLIPEQIVNRTKQGFGVPVHEWLQQGLPRETMDVVSDFMARTDLFDKQAVDNLFADPRAASTRWYVLNVALWWDRFIRRAPAAAGTARSSIAAAPMTAAT
jgi:asparagine synthase (glutamine-hydrolysing)